MLTSCPNNDFFQEISLDAGLDFTHTIGDIELDNIIESVGGGAAFLDFDQDGYLDVFVCNGRWVDGFSKGEKPETPAGNRLYHNLSGWNIRRCYKKSRR